MTLKVAKAIDEYMLDNHIGEYQALFAFHVFYIHYDDDKSDARSVAKAFRKYYSKSNMPIGKQFYNELVDYYLKA